MKCTIHVQYWAKNRPLDKDEFEDQQTCLVAAEAYLAADNVSGVQITIEKEGAR